VTDPKRSELALVMSGGGARAAYQVGILRSIARHHPALELPILTGVSAGAINSVYLSARNGALREKAEALADEWKRLDTEQVFRVDTPSLAANALRLAFKISSGGALTAPRAHALVDTAPLRSLLERLFDARDGEIPGIAQNIEHGRLKAIAITTSSYTTGQTTTWVQGSGIEMWERAHRKSEHTKISVDHVMASAALPIFFPAVEVAGQWYGDGGMRLTAPLSPAVHLGADRIIAISTRYLRSRAEADRPAVDGYPPPAQVLGVLLNAIFLDLFDSDALTMERVNRMIEDVPPEKRRGMRPVKLLVLRPSCDLGRLANEYEVALPRAFRFLTRGLGTRETRSNDMLSLLMFQPDYLARLIELGEADAEARTMEIAAFLEREPSNVTDVEQP
jgi:NTE family protein